MRVLPLAAVSTLALAAAACGPHVDYAARTRLDCPDSVGELTRTAIAADGKSCVYKAGDVDVDVQLTPVNGDPYGALKAIETSLVGTDTGDQAPGAKSAEQSGQAAAAAPASAASKDAAAKAAKDADADAGSVIVSSRDKAAVSVHSGDHNVDVGGDDNDNAHVNLPGVHIDAHGDTAKVDVAGIHIDTNGDNTTVRMMRDVRLRGQPFSREKQGLRATFIDHREGLANGYQVVGYEASGPKTGPLTVAIVKSHDDINSSGRLYRDIQRLVRRNGGA